MNNNEEFLYIEDSKNDIYRLIRELNIKCVNLEELYKEYLPEDMTQDEVQKMIEDILKEKSISQMSQIGEVMGELKKRSNNRADMGFASKFVKEKLS